MNNQETSNGNEIMADQDNPEGLREIERVIASAVIFSSDGYVLMGQKDPARGGVYSDAWHIPGGGIEEGETLPEAAARETRQETGLDIAADKFIPVPIIGSGATVKTLESGERVWCRMQFNRFEVHLDGSASELVKQTEPGDDLVELRWIPPEELADIKQISGGKEFFAEAGYIKAS